MTIPLGALTLVLLASCAPRISRAVARDALPALPTARVQPVTTRLHGITVVDPYRWMEEPASSEFHAWATQQSAHTRATLDQLSLRGELIERLRALSASRDEVDDVKTRAGMRFYLKRPADADTFRLYVRVGDHAAERLLIDPQLVAHDATGSIDYYEPSPGGRRVAFGVSTNGSERSILHIIDVASGQLLPDTIDRARHGEPRWLPDEAALFYRRNPKLGDGAATAATYQGSRDYLHHLGAIPDSDAAVFGYDLSPEVVLASADSPYVYVWPDCQYALAVAQHGTSNDLTIYVAPLASVTGPATPWKRLADTADQVTDFAVHRGDVFLLSHRDAPRAKVVRTPLAAPDLAHAQTVVAEGATVLSELAAASDALYVLGLDRGLGQIVRVPFEAGATKQLALPFAGTLTDFASTTGAPGFSVQLESWARPTTSYAYDPSGERFTELGISPAQSPLPVESIETTVTSVDGTRVPLSIVYLRGLDRTRPHPTLLSGYGSYGISLGPAFSSRRLAWLERGGIYAVAHARGGGELGAGWHLAGMKQHKQRTVDDYLACAEFLIAQGYTSARQLAGEGTSAGGLTVGGAITQRPELFAAALIRVGINDTIRFETTALGPQNAQEFGTSADPGELRALYAMSPYYHVVDHVDYPAVLLTASAHDARVPVWQPGKLAARLQAATASGRPILFRLESDAGHGYGLGTTSAQLNDELADCYAFLLWQLTDRTDRASSTPRK
jgi:prolyl oligopeptidase